MEPAKKLATYDDLLALPEGEKGEIFHGALVVPPAPLPTRESSDVSSAVPSMTTTASAALAAGGSSSRSTCASRCTTS
jgi:hypothetical protein